MKRRIIILYKNGEYSLVKPNKIKDYSFHKVHQVYVPSYDHPNLYIPIMNTDVLKCNNFYVNLEYKMFINSMEANEMFDGQTISFTRETKDPIEFINMIYNLYKFRAISRYIAENNSDYTWGYVNYVIYPVRIQYSYGKYNQLISQHDSGLMRSIQEIESEDLSSLQYSPTIDKRIDQISSILYRTRDVERLEKFISLNERSGWRKLYNVVDERRHNDVILMRLDDFGTYYIAEEHLFSLKNESLYKNLIFSIYVTMDEYKKKNHKFYTYDEKCHLKDLFEAMSLWSPITLEVSIKNIDDFFKIYAYLNTIISYMKYTCTLYMENDLTKTISLVVIEKDKNSLSLLTDEELDSDHLSKAIMNVIEGGNLYHG